MPPELLANLSNLALFYETDFVAWVEANLLHLQNQNYTQVDWFHLIEELSDTSRRERQSLKSNLTILLLHLLKWQHQPQKRSGSWRGSIREHRDRITDTLQDSPSLRSYLPEILPTCYVRARKRAGDETELSLAVFPVDCGYELAEILDEDFCPVRFWFWVLRRPSNSGPV